MNEQNKKKKNEIIPVGYVLPKVIIATYKISQKKINLNLFKYIV